MLFRILNGCIRQSYGENTDGRIDRPGKWFVEYGTVLFHLYTSRRSCHRSFQILDFLDRSGKILFYLGEQARICSWFHSKNFTWFSRIQDSWQNRQILPCQPRLYLHDSWLTGQDLSILSRILLPSWARIWKERWQERRLVFKQKLMLKATSLTEKPITAFTFQDKKGKICS